MESNLLDQLNVEQRAAAAQIEGPVMIIAGAGSGKTRTLTYRIAHMLEEGADAFRIMALTFTNKAAREMQERITALVGPEAKSIWMGTFHSIFLRILRAESEFIGYPKNFSIYDTDDSKVLIKQIVKEKSFDPKVYNPSAILSRISMAKNNLYSAEAYCQNESFLQRDTILHVPETGEIFKIYAQRMQQSAAMDFDDILYYTNILFRDHPDILEKYQKRFRYIMVDEYQDTNYAQYIIIKKLAELHHNICVVGDDSQSIYSFRGANIENILHFETDYPGMKRFKLEQNYRSTDNIVQLSNSIIEKNQDRIPKKVWTENQKGEKIRILKAPTDIDEGNLVAHAIFETKLNHQAFNREFAILYRTNNQSKSMEDALRKLNIPYRIYGGLSFYKRKEIKDVLAYFRWVINPRDEDALMRCINYPARGIGSTSIDRLRILANEMQTSLWDCIMTMKNPQDERLPEAWRSNPTLNLGVRLKIIGIAEKIQSLHTQLTTTDAFTLAQNIWTASGIGEEWKTEVETEQESRLHNVEELLNSVQEFCESKPLVVDEETGEMVETEGLVTLDLFVQNISLLTDMDTDTENDDKVTLMTIHASKGLEFKYVFVVGCEEELFPSARSSNSRKELEEERRLFYVAITRAETRLWLSFSETRMRWGSRDFTTVSRFLQELNPEFLENPRILGREQGLADPFDIDHRSVNAFPTRSTPATRRAATPPDLGKFKKLDKTSASSPVAPAPAVGDSNCNIGSRVRHSKFGEGVVLKIDGFGDNQKIIVRFDAADAGEKTLLSRFAKLEVL